MYSDRYVRQVQLKEIGAEGQRRLANSRILCIGAGGLSSPAALYLAAAGVGTIGLIDPDRIELSNLHRQILFDESDLGHPKASHAGRRLERCNSDVRIDAIVDTFNADNAKELLSRYDIVLDGSDNFDTKFLVNDAAHQAGKPLVYAAVNGFEGQAAAFWSKQSSCYRCLHPEPPKATVQNCSEAGVLGSVVGTIGTLQATLALQLAISGGKIEHPLFPSLGQLTLFDFSGNWRISSFHVPKRSDCPTCSRDPSLLSLQEITIGCSIPSASTASIAALKAKLDEPRSALLLIDVRSTEEWEAGHIPQASHWPLDRIENGSLPPIPNPSVPIILYCKSGIRSARAAQLLRQAGILSTQNLIGGMDAWSNAYPELIHRLSEL